MIILFFFVFFNAVDINKAFCMFICLLVRFMTNLLCALVFFVLVSSYIFLFFFCGYKCCHTVSFPVHVKLSYRILACFCLCVEMAEMLVCINVEVVLLH